MWADPFEDSVGAWEVTHYKNGHFLDLNYDQGTLQNVMIRIATKVNENFYSADNNADRLKDDRVG